MYDLDTRATSETSLSFLVNDRSKYMHIKFITIIYTYIRETDGIISPRNRP
jgi:hypothetical protein